MAPISLKKVGAYFMTSTSIIGVAVASPTFLAVLTNKITWQEAVIPLLGAAISLAIPQRGAPIADGQAIVTSLTNLGTEAAPVLVQSPNPIVRDVGLALPAITDELEHAWADYQAAQARLSAAKTAASQQASKLTASLAKTTIVPGGSSPTQTVGLAAAKPLSPVDAALSGQSATGSAYDPVAMQAYTPAGV